MAVFATMTPPAPARDESLVEERRDVFHTMDIQFSSTQHNFDHSQFSDIYIYICICIYIYIYIYVCFFFLTSRNTFSLSHQLHSENFILYSDQFGSVVQSCLTLCDPMDCSRLGLPVHRQLPEFTQAHVHWVSDATQMSHHLSSPPPQTFNLSQHQGLSQWVSSSHQVAKVLEFQLQH